MEKFFNEIVSTPAPIDLRALLALRQSPMAIDLYCWLTYRNFSLQSSTAVPWEALKLQFGSGAEAEKKFRGTVKRAGPGARGLPGREGHADKIWPVHVALAHQRAALSEVVPRARPVHNLGRVKCD